MALRFIQKSQLLKQTSIRQATRYFASESKQSAHHYPQETFGTNAWRNGVAIVVAGFVWYRIDQHLTQSGDEKHPFTRWIEYHMTTSEENDSINAAQLAGAEAAAEYKLLAQDAQRPPIYRMRYPESFERASPRALVTGNQTDLSDLKVRID
ncbi:hypothetical protein G6F47_010979 [Rhizopus delemar]|uniref:Uncharacterized protein n=3 Tax=Rhizopus TaxID=4842 RepID=I1C0B5_RHIO9|nr:hypothetical protein RO3G_06600 [Rhizopus delemar RA 99-880]KAG1582053.1 hypothetical protein G6F48_009409 [Rhizopus delemar]KAG1587272.1 hypothetical protein G6F47_010979 [Rhizopus delemar]|eukprot:EIE81895.1 hypothetical protein RO3G_06600 [Rhizopus delemar RA 99-880]